MWIKFDGEMHNSENIAAIALYENKIVVTYNGREAKNTLDFVSTSDAREAYRRIEKYLK